mgnify:CR=1 FL=1
MPSKPLTQRALTLTAAAVAAAVAVSIVLPRQATTAEARHTPPLDAPSSNTIDMHRAHESSEGKRQLGPRYAHYRARWAQCRRVLWLHTHEDTSGLKLKWGGRGNYQDMVQCRKKWRPKARKNTLLAIRYVFPESEWRNADIVTACEGGPSRRIDARGDSGHSRSAFQINDLYWRYNHDQIQKDAVYAARIAKSIWQTRGWRPWTCGRINGLA